MLDIINKWSIFFYSIKILIVAFLKLSNKSKNGFMVQTISVNILYPLWTNKVSIPHVTEWRSKLVPVQQPITCLLWLLMYFDFFYFFNFYFKSFCSSYVLFSPFSLLFFYFDYTFSLTTRKELECWLIATGLYPSFMPTLLQL